MVVFHPADADEPGARSWTSSWTGCAGGWPTGGWCSRSPTPARAWLAEHGYDPVYGARPLRRLIQSAIGDQLARALLGGEIRDGDTVVIDRVGDAAGLTVTARR